MSKLSVEALRDPTAETGSAQRARKAPPSSLAGLTVGLFSIGKARTAEFLDRLEQRLRERGLKVARFGKPTNAKTATREVIQQVIGGCDVVIVGLSDWGSCTSCSLHDLMQMDAGGVPGVTVVTSAFKDSVEMHTRMLGFDPAVLYVPHPIQNRTASELDAIADSVVEPLLALLVSPL